MQKTDMLPPVACFFDFGIRICFEFRISDFSEVAMADNSTDEPTLAEVRTVLHMIADLLRHARNLGPEAQGLLADLIDELGVALESPDVPNAEVARLATCAAQLVQAVQEKGKPGVFEAAEDRLERAAVAVETGAPGLANLTRRLAEMLSDLGI
jgi:hypothetical protein